MSADMLPRLVEVQLQDEEATQKLGASFARPIAVCFAASRTAPFLYFSGDLGAGKTTLVRALLRALGIAGRIKSPTYTLVEPYEISLSNLSPVHAQSHTPIADIPERAKELSLYSQLQCYHFDFYRFTDSHEWTDAGFREYFDRNALCLVEWPDNAGPGLPRADLRVWLSTPTGESGRRARLEAFSEIGLACLNAAASSGKA